MLGSSFFCKERGSYTRRKYTRPSLSDRFFNFFIANMIPKQTREKCVNLRYSVNFFLHFGRIFLF